MAVAHFPASIENLAPFRATAPTEGSLPAALSGALPDWLRGELVRTCPAVFQSNGWKAEHWFDALGMLYAFHVGADGVSFRSKLLDSEASRDAFKGKSRLATFGTSMRRSPLQRLFEPVPRATDNANVNVVRMGTDLVAMTEAPRQLRMNLDTLATEGVVKYEDTLPDVIMSAHPHFDFEKNLVVNVATRIGAKPAVCLYQHAPNERRRSLIGTWNSKRLPYVHAFSLTPAHAILICHPFSFNPLQLLWSNRGFIDHFKWQPEDGTRLVVMDRKTGQTREHVTDAFFVFHTVNAFESKEETVLDVLAYPDASIVASARVERLAQVLPEMRPSLVRIRLRRGVERAQVEKIGDVGFEFPAINYRRCNGKDYQFVWGGSNGAGPNGYNSSLIKLDVRNGASVAYSNLDYIFGEPVFVARPGASEEDDGVLLSVGSHMKEDTSVLAVIDAKSMQLVAKAVVPLAIPLGFHGSFLRAPSTAGAA